jgi:hypothetical protein
VSNKSTRTLLAESLSHPAGKKSVSAMATSGMSHEPLCAIDPHSLIINEIILVTSAMRKSARWASSGVAAILGGSANGDEGEGLAVRWGLRRGKRSSQSADSMLMAEFSKLRAELSDCKGNSFDVR